MNYVLSFGSFSVGLLVPSFPFSLGSFACGLV